VADAPEIKVKLTAEDTGVAAAIKELGNQLKTLKTQEKETAASAISLGSALRGLAAAGAALEFGLIAKSAFDSAVNIGRMADKTGASTQSLSVFHHVAEELGVSTESVDKALVKASKSITQFEQGSKTAAQGFALLGLSQKQFAGLNSDQKLLLVTNALGKMTAGAQKATAAQLIFSKGGSDFIPVANAIAGEGFDKITASVSKLGLLLTRDMTDSAQAAKASLQELEDVGAGFATQFEAGILPAVSDVGEALAESLTQGGVNFKSLGEYAGEAVRGISLAFLALGQTIGTVLESILSISGAVWGEIKNQAITEISALGQASTGHFITAFNTVKTGVKNATGIVTEEVARQMAIFGTLKDSVQEDYKNLFPSAEEEARRKKERIAKLRPDKTEEVPLPPLATSPNDAAQRAAASQFEKYLQDELSLLRATAKQTEEIEKQKYDQGEISLKEYFDRRRAAVTADASEESAILQREITAQVHAAEAAGAAGRSADTPKEKDKQDALRIQALTKVMDLQTKLKESQIEASTKLTALNLEESKAVDDLQKKRLTFENELLVAQGKTFEAARQKIIAEGEEMKDPRALAKSGTSAEDVQKLTNIRLETLAFEQQQKSEQAALSENADKRDEVLNRVKTGQIFEAQGEAEIRKIEQERLVILQQIAKQLQARAEVTGADSDRSAAAAAAKNADDANAQLDTTGQHVAALKGAVQGGLTSGFANFFETVGRGNQTVARSFENLAASVVGSLQKVASQMLATYLMKKLLGGSDSSDNSSGGGGGGGGLFGVLAGLFSGHAAGGLIKGQGGPTSDSVPARLSPGEYVVKASAVSAFGAHNLEAINRGLQVPSLANLRLPKFAEGGLVGPDAGRGSLAHINLGIGLDEGLILHHLGSKDAGRIILNHLTNNPKAAGKALGRSTG
jgi:hypothetical protein